MTPRTQSPFALFIRKWLGVGLLGAGLMQFAAAVAYVKLGQVRIEGGFGDLIFVIGSLMLLLLLSLLSSVVSIIVLIKSIDRNAIRIAKISLFFSALISCFLAYVFFIHP